MSWLDSLSEFAKDAFEDTRPKWAEEISPLSKVFGEDYIQHLFNTSLIGSPSLGFGLDYKQFRAEGDSDYATKQVWENVGASAAILALIFGGGYISSLGEGAGAGAETSAVPAAETSSSGTSAADPTVFDTVMQYVDKFGGFAGGGGGEQSQTKEQKEPTIAFTSPQDQQERDIALLMQAFNQGKEQRSLLE